VLAAIVLVAGDCLTDYHGGTKDLAGLRHLSRRLGARMVAGYVLYTGQQTLPFGDGLRAVPIDALWTTGP
jgi:hypothetical protein